jgi:hypothetical protein
MAWSASKIFVATIEDILENTTALDLNNDTFKVALYDNDITPDQTVTSANTAYNAGQWVSAGNEVFDGAEWPSTGQALDSVTFAATSNVLKFDAADEVSTGTSATLANVYGCLVYSDTIAAPVADQGVCYLYFGGVNSVGGRVQVPC